MTMEQTLWNSLILEISQGHLLQTWDWGQSRAETGWQVSHQVWNCDQADPAIAAMVMSRGIKLGPVNSRFRVQYAPRGPLLDWSIPARVDRALAALEDLARRDGVIFLRIDPEVIIGTGVPQEGTAVDDTVGLAVQDHLHRRGWRFGADQVQFRNTIWIDLQGTEENWLARMKQKTRYNLRLAQRKGVTVRQAQLSELPLLYRMYAATADRDGFVIRQQQYYLNLWHRFIHQQMATALIAEIASQPVAALILFHFGNRAWYLYGMSSGEHREAMPTYLLQWEAMRYAREKGCTIYDLWGAPDDFTQQDSLWGVYRFKMGWGGRVVRTIGAWDYTARPALYRVFTSLLPAFLSILRFWRRRQTRREVSP